MGEISMNEQPILNRERLQHICWRIDVGGLPPQPALLGGVSPLLASPPLENPEQ